MPHHTPLIGTIVAGLVVAFLMGAFDIFMSKSGPDKPLRMLAVFN